MTISDLKKSFEDSASGTAKGNPLSPGRQQLHDLVREYPSSQVLDVSLDLGEFRKQATRKLRTSHLISNVAVLRNATASRASNNHLLRLTSTHAQLSQLRAISGNDDFI